MTTTLPPKSDIRVADGQVDLTLTLQLEPDSATALVRTLVVLHRRCCRVTEARYQSRIGECDRLNLRVLAPPAHAHCVPTWLAALVEVRTVIAVPGRCRRGGSSVEAVAADPAAYLGAAHQREMAKLGHANIFISGQPEGI